MSNERRIMDDPIVVGLRKARALIEDPNKWGGWTRPGWQSGFSLCAEMAVHAATTPNEEMNSRVAGALKAALPSPFTRVADYNDTYTHAEVLALFDRAIAMRLEELGCQSAAPTT